MSNAVPEPVIKLTEAFARLPGVGPKTAARLTYFLLRAPDELSLSLAEALENLKAETRFCSVCYNITVNDPCDICNDDRRDANMVAVVEEPLDVLALERTGVFTGKYHVLHGAISPVNNIGPDELRIRELVERVEKDNILEVIIATNPGMEGDATAMFIERELKPKGVKTTRLARGLPVGSDLEYVDPVTLTRALQGRSEF
ncbi:MAG: recombination protein RecR [Anaerolineaceae bacterium]|nr:recombination protein RecR [Anaerolineaceae bacterium]